MKRFRRAIVMFGIARLAVAAIWLVLALAFLVMAFSGYRSMNVRIARAGFRLPSKPNIQLGNLRLQHVINDLAEKYDTTAATLEQSIRGSARSAFWLNLMAAFLSLTAFATQCQWRRGRPQTEASTLPPEEAGQLTFLSRPIHNGSFPDGGYSR